MELDPPVTCLALPPATGHSAPAPGSPPTRAAPRDPRRTMAASASRAPRRSCHLEVPWGKVGRKLVHDEDWIDMIIVTQ